MPVYLLIALILIGAINVTARFVRHPSMVLAFVATVAVVVFVIGCALEVLA